MQELSFKELYIAKQLGWRETRVFRYNKVQKNGAIYNGEWMTVPRSPSSIRKMINRRRTNGLYPIIKSYCIKL